MAGVGAVLVERGREAHVAHLERRDLELLIGGRHVALARPTKHVSECDKMQLDNLIIFSDDMKQLYGT